MTLPNAPNASAAISPPNNGPALDGGPISASDAAISKATDAQLVTPAPRRPAKAATIINTMPPTVRISSGRMGAKSFIVRGLGNPASFQSASHGAGRRMSRTEARQRFNARDLEDQTEGVECRKDRGVVDEAFGDHDRIDVVVANAGYGVFGVAEDLTDEQIDRMIATKLAD